MQTVWTTSFQIPKSVCDASLQVQAHHVDWCVGQTTLTCLLFVEVLPGESDKKREKIKKGSSNLSLEQMSNFRRLGLYQCKWRACVLLCSLKCPRQSYHKGDKGQSYIFYFYFPPAIYQKCRVCKHNTFYIWWHQNKHLPFVVVALVTLMQDNFHLPKLIKHPTIILWVFAFCHILSGPCLCSA